jgi:cytochrome c-type biogenesis protein CcmE
MLMSVKQNERITKICKLIFVILNMGRILLLGFEEEARLFWNPKISKQQKISATIEPTLKESVS